ncbi:MAG: N-acetylglucosaminyldiphosphodolichol N-acetylglucosaminyltransferase catalytic subunit alg13 [Tremellales sp. Tagirdzhanova-0007]|nr:MAG: N-acetylglucosaminyldiphosphodolichol N-acetylglucosaminyltransferase catalytic subunit alg13 [Tremellales sp. Tagirdzhanova-0007]
MSKEARRPSTLLVTVGSTLFPPLTDLVLSSPFLDHLSTQAVSRLIVHLDYKGAVTFSWKEMSVEIMRFTDDFEGLVKQVDGVISHAGSGSILTVLRRAIPLLVVPNTSLMDNHQAELASALEAQGFLTVSTVEDLQAKLAGWLRSPARQDAPPFPPLESGRFRAILDETAGFGR